MKTPTFDSDGYPTDATLRVIEKWPITELSDTQGLMDYVRQAWKYPDYFTADKRRTREWKGAPLKRRYHVSTGGWSGNESLISALEKNFVFWMLTWVAHRRGGHYIFELPE